MRKMILPVLRRHHNSYFWTSSCVMLLFALCGFCFWNELCKPSGFEPLGVRHHNSYFWTTSGVMFLFALFGFCFCNEQREPSGSRTPGCPTFYPQRYTGGGGFRDAFRHSFRLSSYIYTVSNGSKFFVKAFTDFYFFLHYLNKYFYSFTFSCLDIVFQQMFCVIRKTVFFTRKFIFSVRWIYVSTNLEHI